MGQGEKGNEKSFNSLNTLRSKGGAYDTLQCVVWKNSRFGGQRRKRVIPTGTHNVEKPRRGERVRGKEGLGSKRESRESA